MQDAEPTAVFFSNSVNIFWAGLPFNMDGFNTARSKYKPHGKKNFLMRVWKKELANQCKAMSWITRKIERYLQTQDQPNAWKSDLFIFKHRANMHYS